MIQTLLPRKQKRPAGEPDGARLLQEIYKPDRITNSSRLFFARQSSSRDVVHAGFSSP
jgi:hypothetical protein